MRTRVLLVLAALSLLAGCGGAASSGSGTANGNVHHALPTDPKPYVLELADLGAGWESDLQNTRAVGLDDAMNGDPPALKRLERKVYRGGFRAQFYRGHQFAVNSTAFTYASTRDARRVAAGWARSASTILQHLRRLAVPSPALGSGDRLWQGTSAGLPAYLVQWVNGNIVAGIVVVGTGVTPSEVVRLARKQEARIHGRPRPAPPLPGEAARPASQILADARRAVASASGAHLFEDVDGQRLDFRASRARGYGTITTAKGVARVRRVGTRIWSNADGRLASHTPNPGAATRLAGRWIAIPSTNEGYFAMSSLTSLRFIAGMLEPARDAALAPTTIGTARMGGRLVVVVALEHAGGSREAVYVPVTGTPYPLAVDQPAERSGGVARVLLDGWNAPFSVTPPAHPVTTAGACGCIS